MMWGVGFNATIMPINWTSIQAFILHGSFKKY